jgi:hypothetical protein
MEKKVLKVLVRRGFNAEFAAELINKNLMDAKRMFPEAKASKLAEVVSCL